MVDLNAMNVTDIAGLIQYDNAVVGGVYGIGLCVMVFAIAFGASWQSGRETSLVISIFFTYLTSLFLASLNILNAAYTFVPMALLIVAVIMLLMKKEGSSYG